MKKIFFLAASGLCLSTLASEQPSTRNLQNQLEDLPLDQFPDNFWPNSEDFNENLEILFVEGEDDFLPPPPPPDFHRPHFPHHGGRRHHRGGPHGRHHHHPPPMPFDSEEAGFIGENAESGEGAIFNPEGPEGFGPFGGFRHRPHFLRNNETEREGPRGWGRRHRRHHGRFGPRENATVSEENLIDFDKEFAGFAPPRHHRHHRPIENYGSEEGGRGSWKPYFRRGN